MTHLTHNGPLRPGAWYACDQPERPPDADTAWHTIDCRGCTVSIEAIGRQYPDDVHAAWLADALAHCPPGRSAPPGLPHWMQR